MKTLFKNARILTMDTNDFVDGQYKIIKDGYLIVDNDKIVYIGDSLNGYSDFGKTIDCQGNLLMPGFVNCHTHSPMTFVRSYCDNHPLQQWLFEDIFPLEAKLTDEDVYCFTKVAILEYLSSGITFVWDMYGHELSVLDAMVDMGMRCIMTRGIMARDKDLSEIEDFYLKANNIKKDTRHLTKYYMDLHAEYTNTKESIKFISDFIHKYNMPFFAHNSETKLEVEECKKRWGGKTPTEVFEEFDLFANGGGQAHCVYLSDNDIEIFKKHNVSVITNPSSNLKLASGVADLKKYYDMGVHVAIGTDGPSSNNCLDMFKEMFLACNLDKPIYGDASAVCPYKVLASATRNGAKTLGRDDIGVLKAGNKADLIMIDLQKPNMQPLNNIVTNLVYSGQTRNVKLTMIDGRILYRDGKFYVGEDENDIYKKAQELSDDIKKR